ncbi:hypothetical protein [Membranihabitans maritimus]|uniref:hypothetical protein n=1 Tax=Membranihabitans maritimus TaxID=2904244 RepID=UPI001F379BC0|nr:hypothetical protein [Membranihabitans maritimus]
MTELGYTNNIILIRRIVPDLYINYSVVSIIFYSDFGGLEITMDLGWGKTFPYRENPQALIPHYTYGTIGKAQ